MFSRPRKRRGFLFTARWDQTTCFVPAMADHRRDRGKLKPIARSGRGDPEFRHRALEEALKPETTILPAILEQLT